MIKENILEIKERISVACSKIGRNPAEISLVAVSKGRSAEEIEEVISAGITDIGENKVQEASVKYRHLRLKTCDLRLHMVGHLQTNKVKEAVRIFDLIHSVDSLRLAQEIDKQAAKINKLQDVLIEIKTSSEETKSGLKPDEAIGVIKVISALKNIRILGLMTIAPLVGSPEETRAYFRVLRELFNKINDLRLITYNLRLLSMGMSNDFEVAIEEGANMVRVGRAIFES